MKDVMERGEKLTEQLEKGKEFWVVLTKLKLINPSKKTTTTICALVKLTKAKQGKKPK